MERAANRDDRARRRRRVWALLHGRPDREQARALAAEAREAVEVETLQAISRGQFTAVGELIDAGLLEL